SHLPASPYSNSMKPVILPPGRARLRTKPAPTGSTTCRNTIGILRVACSRAGMVGPTPATITSGPSATSSATSSRKRAASPAAHVDPQLAADDPARFLQALVQRCDFGLRVRVVGSGAHEDADASHLPALLCARHQRPRRRAAEQRHELAPS